MVNKRTFHEVRPQKYGECLTNTEAIAKMKYDIEVLFNSITTGLGVKAEQLANPCKINLKNNVMGSEEFDGTQDIDINAIFNNSSIVKGNGWYRIAYNSNINDKTPTNFIMMYQTLNTKKMGMVKFNAKHKIPMSDIDFTFPQIVIDDFEIIGPVDVNVNDFKIVYWINPCTNKTEVTFYYYNHADEISIFTEVQLNRVDYDKGYNLEVNPTLTYDNFKGTEIKPTLNFYINSIELDGDIQGKELITDKDIVIMANIKQSVKDGIKQSALDSIKEGQNIKITRKPLEIEIASTVKDYTLPIATAKTIGGVKIGENLTITEDGTLNSPAKELQIASKETLGGIKVGQNLSITEDGTLNSEAKELQIASKETLGGIKVGQNLSITEDGTLNSQDTVYTLPIASKENVGGVKIGENLKISVDGTLDSVNVNISKTPTTINRYYNNVNITNSGSFIRGDMAHYNYKVTKIDEGFVQNTFYKIGKMEVLPTNNFNVMPALGNDIITNQFTSIGSSYTDENGDVYLVVTSKCSEIVVMGQIPIKVDTSTLAPIETEAPVSEDVPLFYKKSPYWIWEHLTTVDGYHLAPDVYWQPIITDDLLVKVRYYYNYYYTNSGPETTISYPSNYNESSERSGWSNWNDDKISNNNKLKIQLECPALRLYNIGFNDLAIKEMSRILQYSLDKVFVDEVMTQFSLDAINKWTKTYGNKVMIIIKNNYIEVGNI